MQHLITPKVHCHWDQHSTGKFLSPASGTACLPLRYIQGLRLLWSANSDAGQNICLSDRSHIFTSGTRVGLEVPSMDAGLVSEANGVLPCAGFYWGVTQYFVTRESSLLTFLFFPQVNGVFLCTALPVAREGWCVQSHGYWGCYIIGSYQSSLLPKTVKHQCESKACKSYSSPATEVYSQHEATGVRQLWYGPEHEPILAGSWVLTFHKGESRSSICSYWPNFRGWSALSHDEFYCGGLDTMF